MKTPKKSPKPKTLKGRVLIQVVTGSIAAYKAADLTRVLRDAGAKVYCVMTPGAKHFVTPLVLRAVSGERVFDDFFSVQTDHGVLHTELAEKADAILVAPASADFIAKLACGMADDLASCLILAVRKPVVIVPAMNDHMYQHPLTQENMQKLERIGYRFVQPAVGRLVCGKESVGHIADPARILSVLQQSL
ncbi:MAG: flavoprotein [Candidatus Omnitrophota bacterium]